MSPDALLARLDNRLDLLTGGAPDRTARQQTLRGAIDWSYNLLAPQEQLLFARLGVFVAGISIEAAETICGAISAETLVRARESFRWQRGKSGPMLQVLDGLEVLADESLLRNVESTGGEPRFMM